MCEAEVDPDTGTIEVRRYTSIDDGGQPINPLILHGQVHGGVAQGVGQAMMEAAVYEPGSGQLLSASFLDYGMPRADHFPHLEVELTEDPTKGNALRVKGGGEAGITPSSAVLINAVIDALSGFGIEHIDMPATPQRVWAAIRAARWSNGNEGPLIVRRRDFITFSVAPRLSRGRSPRAQQPAMPVVGFLRSTAAAASANFVAAFRKGLGEAGFVEGQNVAIEYLWRTISTIGCRRWLPISSAAKWR